MNIQYFVSKSEEPIIYVRYNGVNVATFILPDELPKHVKDIVLKTDEILSTKRSPENELFVQLLKTNVLQFLNEKNKDGKTMWKRCYEEWQELNPQEKSNPKEKYFFSIPNVSSYPPYAYVHENSGRLIGALILPISNPKHPKDIQTFADSPISRQQLLELLNDFDEYDVPVWKSLLIRWDMVNPDVPVWKSREFARKYDSGMNGASFS